MKAQMQAAQEKVNKNPTPWILTMGILISVLSFIGVFIFTQVTAAPTTYETIAQHDRDVDRQDREQKEMAKKIDDGFNRIHDLIIELHKK